MKKVLGLGNALVDIMTPLEHDSFLADYGLEKGSMQLVDRDFSNRVLEGATALKKELASGGSASNTIHGLARMGVPAGFIGTVGQDEFGDFFRDDMIQAGIQPTLYTGKDATGRAIALVSKDGQRTFATFLGAAIELSADHLKESDFAGYDYFHIEGYLVQNYALVEKAIALAKKTGLKISLDLASFNVVEQHLEFLQRIVQNHVDIVFANEDEARAFTGEEANMAVDIFSKSASIAVVKTGEKGSLVKSGSQLTVVNAIPANCIDTTGAGDLYAAGFLYGLTQGLSLLNCGNIGSLLGGNVIEVIGAKISDDRWEKIRAEVAHMR
jgi:sugar/nucleoside kinase (ribokinase family)